MPSLIISGSIQRLHNLLCLEIPSGYPSWASFKAQLIPLGTRSHCLFKRGIPGDILRIPGLYVRLNTQPLPQCQCSPPVEPAFCLSPSQSSRRILLSLVLFLQSSFRPLSQCYYFPRLQISIMALEPTLLPSPTSNLHSSSSSYVGSLYRLQISIMAPRATLVLHTNFRTPFWFLELILVV